MAPKIIDPSESFRSDAPGIGIDPRANHAKLPTKSAMFKWSVTKP